MQHAGLEHCHVRSKEKIYKHPNMPLSTISVSKQLFWVSLPNKQEVPVSIKNIKTRYYNKFLAELIFSNLAVDLNCKKIKRLFNQCISGKHPVNHVPIQSAIIISRFCSGQQFMDSIDWV